MREHDPKVSDAEVEACIAYFNRHVKSVHWNRDGDNCPYRDDFVRGLLAVAAIKRASQTKDQP